MKVPVFVKRPARTRPRTRTRSFRKLPRYISTEGPHCDAARVVADFDHFVDFSRLRVNHDDRARARRCERGSGRAMSGVLAASGWHVEVVIGDVNPAAVG